jgi:hypothetical protein
MSKQDIQEINRIVNEEGLSPERRRLLHEEISGQNFSLEQIREIAWEIKKLYPRK